MEDFVRKTNGVRDIKSLPLDTSHELDIVSDVKGKIYIKILNRYKELLFDNGTEPWVTEMLNKLEVDVEQLKEDVLDLEQALTELPIIEDKLEAVETKLAQINTLFAQMQIDVQGLDLRTAELEREVVQLALKDQELLDKINNLDLGKISTLYSNSIDFGDYDYSGNPNIAPNVGFNDFYNNESQTGYTAKDEVDHIAVTRTADAPPAGKLLNLRTLLPNKTYTLSVDIWADMEVPSNAIQCQFRLREGTEVRSVWALINKPVSTNRKTYSVTFTTAANFVTTEESRISLWLNASAGACTCYLGYNIKIEEGSTATPYQPNLLDAPYHLSKVPLGENIADPTVEFPITLSTEGLHAKNALDDFVLGETYTVTIGATKPASQTFRVYLAQKQFSDFKPVEGLVDTWVATVSITKLGENTKGVYLLQTPNTSLGSCTIKWLKIEKGDTRTPNIPFHKYLGINLKESERTKDYEWIPLASAAETVDARLSKTISTYDTVNALQNNRLTALESKVVDTTWQNVSVTEPFTSVTQPQVKRQNGIVYMRGTISNGTGDCFTLPEGFRPPAGAYEMQFRLPCRSASAANYATIYVRPSGLCSIAGVNGTMPIFLSGIIFSTT